MSSKKKLKRHRSRDEFKVIFYVLSLIETINYSLFYRAFVSLIAEDGVCVLTQGFPCINVGSFALGSQIVRVVQA